MSLTNVLQFLFGSKQDRDLKNLNPVLAQVNSFKAACVALSDDALKNKTAEFKEQLAQGKSLEAILPEAFAVFREATFRVLGERRLITDPATKLQVQFMAHFDVQVLGAITLHTGRIAEMRTGEGKTQVAAMAAYANALTGKGVHVITVNDYLAKRDSEWMGRIYSFLGLTVGCLDKTEPSTSERREQYHCDITYGTNNEFGFDFLRDNMASTPDQLVQRSLNYAVIDEVDNILIDEARTPLIISGAVTKSTHEYDLLKPRVVKVVSAQNLLIQKMVNEAEELIAAKGDEYQIGRTLYIVQKGSPKNKKLGKLLKEEGVVKLVKTVEADYLRERKLHELEEELFFALDESGHSAELTEKGRQLISGSGDPDFFVVPDLATLIGAIEKESDLPTEEKAAKKDEAHRLYADRSARIHSISQLLRAYVLFERDVDYVVQDGQILIVDEFTGRILQGRRWSEGLHQSVEAKEGVKVAGENQTLATVTFQNFFKMYTKFAGMTGTAMTEAAEFHEIYKLDVVMVPTNRAMVRNDHNDEIYRTQREKYNAVIKEITDAYARGQPCLIGTTSIEKSELISKFLQRAGIKHEVLNAKQHAREAMIVAQAGRLKAVTIATNMAGRGTDIVLGGNFEVMANNELTGEGINPDDLAIDEKRKRFAALFSELSAEHDQVVAVGGLHIIGTERHESRRIDNQLRGRAGRQGDPGSSKFFLSLDDDLMRIFGSGRIAAIMDKLGAQEGEVISHGLVSRAIGNAQKRVEGRNFEIRKHLKDYDDVMNYQRTEIYGLRQRLVRGENVRTEVVDQIESYLEDVVLRFTNDKGTDNWDLKALANELAATCGVQFNADDDSIPHRGQKKFYEEITAMVTGRYTEKETRLGSDLMRHLERGVFLMVIDNLWKDHLYEMDHLRSDVQYRAFGQKNPLFEYQREALKFFGEFRSTLARDATSFIFRMERVEQQDRMGLARATLSHGQVDMFNAAEQARPMPQTPVQPGTAATRPGPSSAGVRSAVPIRVVPAAGRNDACPCGSGKKYKKCHGAV